MAHDVSFSSPSPAMLMETVIRVVVLIVVKVVVIDLIKNSAKF